MPNPKRKPDIGRKSPNAKRLQAKRDCKTPDEVDAQRNRTAQFMRRTRANKQSIVLDTTNKSIDTPHSIMIASQPVIIAPEPVIIAPQPVIIAPQTVIIAPQPVIIVPQPVIIAPQPMEIAPQSAVLRILKLSNAATVYRPRFPYSLGAFDIGCMNSVCQYCGALKWENEAPSMCCSLGKVHFHQMPELPKFLHELMQGSSPLSKKYLENIRLYNCAFQMTSFGANQIRERGFMPTFKVQGQIYHLAGSIYPVTNKEPAFLQVYFVSNRDYQANIRSTNFPSLNRELILQLQDMLNMCNAYIVSFKSAIEKLPSPHYKLHIRADKTPSGEHARRFNAPTGDEVGVIISGESEGAERRDIIIEQRDSKLQRVNETHRSYDALQYPLLFPFGEDGYNFEIHQFDHTKKQYGTKKTVTAMQFYAYKMMQRGNSFNILLHSRSLSQQFWVDMYAKIEAERLLYIKLHQKELRAENYIHLKDAISADENVPNNFGQRVILPSTFTGSPRYMHERSQDGMVYVRKFGRPDLFITFTCNPNWPEITSQLQNNEQPHQRHDIIARVFHLKLKKLMEVIVKKEVFGHVIADLHTVEWQKRGLPHAHILLWLQKKVTADDIDKMVSAELPDPNEDPVLFDIVKNNMIHGPCGLHNPTSPCMQDRKCTKNYPKPFVTESQTGADSYPLYRRRSPDQGGHTATINSRGHQFVVDNSWVVPHNRFLCRAFDAHINVEICTSIKSIKYVCKYVHKGSDMAVYQITAGDKSNKNEVEIFQIGRYINANEAHWRILGFPMHHHNPPVTHLSVHLENGQRVYFTSETAQRVADQNPPDTTLTEFFKLCVADDFARTLYYNEVPEYYTWHKPTKSWKKRKTNARALARVYTIHPNAGECYYLRLLLHKVKGPTSYTYLRTVDRHECDTFKEACNLLGILESDQHWIATLEDASLCQSAGKIRQLFAVMIHFCDISDVKTLWETFKESMSEDFLHRMRRTHSVGIQFSNGIFNAALIEIEEKLLSLPGGKPIQEYGLPEIDRDHDEIFSREIWRETNYDAAELESIISTRSARLTPDQNLVYQKICEFLSSQTGGIFFLDAPGGTGKTYLLNLILATVRHSGNIALAVASSGIAATLLKGGKTAHSTFKLPLNLSSVETPTCNIKSQTNLGKLMQMTKLIVWDECTMSHKRAFEALDRTLKDIRQNNSVMGGIILFLAGDFRQTLPIIQRGTRADQVNASLKKSFLWRQVLTMKLHTNMRALLTGDGSHSQFSRNLLMIGEGNIKEDKDDGLISIPEDLCTIIDDHDRLLYSVFPQLSTNYKDAHWLSERAVLAPRNEDVRELNKTLLDQLPTDLVTYASIDSTPDIDEAVDYPVEFLNSLVPSGMPLHKLDLKIGAPIMLLRNLDAPRLCNGTRLIVKTLMPNLIEATITLGAYTGESVLIPRIPLIPSNCPFVFKRLQFPVTLAFAITVKKSQRAKH